MRLPNRMRLSVKCAWRFHSTTTQKSRFFSWSDEKGEINFAMEFTRVLWQAQLRTENFRRRRPQKGRIPIDLIDVKKIIRESFRLTRHSLGQVYWQPKIELISVNRQHSDAIWWLHFRPVIIVSFLIPAHPRVVHPTDESRNLSQLPDQDVLSSQRTERCVTEDWRRRLMCKYAENNRSQANWCLQNILKIKIN